MSENSEFKKLIYSWFKSLVQGERAFLHNKSGHIFQGGEGKMKEVTGIVN